MQQEPSSGEKMTDIISILNKESDFLLKHVCTTIPRHDLQLPGADFIDRVMAFSNRKPSVLRNLQALYNHGRLAGTGYLSLLPVDQGVEHSAGASFAPNPMFFDPKHIVPVSIRPSIWVLAQ